MRIPLRQAPPAAPPEPNPLARLAFKFGVKAIGVSAVLVLAMIGLAIVPAVLVSNAVLLLLIAFGGVFYLARRRFRALTVQAYLGELVDALRPVRRGALIAAGAISAAALISSIASHAGILSTVQNSIAAGLFALLAIALWRRTRP
ncbi:hypothetical protein Sked_28920 [Sanguibacter keddieii DSM 10542]|uniref:Uncharacterized protein n=1 Tax=Sanguibacter keddieii (strain ATCC 51767 / DSM 10542 / NCFB 3025 / ST-74) TaxID=446469 RepID=D1BBM3_SANKS|nr:hypothetical protein [Sanguibacter keddieii]ACZ22794.1 hypothetical protein Sked_28920 [Sanguibacter keddieii DSM 10542]